MNLRASAFVVALVAASAGCSSGSDDSNAPPPGAYTVSYRNQVRLPQDGRVMSAPDYEAQLRAADPIASARCAPDTSKAFGDLASFLGGYAWSHPVSIIKDASFPPLYNGKFIPQPPSESAAGAGDGAAPVIERPDLIGVQNGIGIFLSKQHGLIAVDARGSSPKVSCSMKLPGEPQNFLFKDNQLVMVVNARDGQNRSALVRYSFDGAKFHFIDSVQLEGQIIKDARLFDSTIVAYTAWSKPGTGVATNSGGFYPQNGNGNSSYQSENDLSVKVLVIQWDDKLDLDWQDSLLDDPIKRDPTEGSAPVKYSAGQVVSERKSYKQFVAASDRYVAVPRDVEQTVFNHYEKHTYEVCTKYNPQYEQIPYCTTNYEQRPNPDYVPPNPTTGDYSCGGKSLADCIQTAAPTVSQYIEVPTGQTCGQYWVGHCDAYETRVDVYPVFDTKNTTEMTIYRFGGGSFTKLDSKLGKLVQDPTKPDAITFETNPLSVTGTISNRNQIQFQNGELYVFADAALQTLSVAGNSISYLNRLAIDANTTNNPSIVFSSDRAMISSVTNYNSSQVTMLDLSTPSLPKPIKSFDMPGQSTQLLLATGGILGPGNVSFSNQQVDRTLEKLTLFSKDGGNELDNLLLGTEYDTFETSWFDTTDDQRIRLSANGQRLFLPYSGRHHANQYDPVAHRLNISRIDSNRLVSERSFAVSDDIIRTAPLDDARSLVFGNSAAYLVDHTSGDWVLSTLRELFVPFATYRLNDQDLYARVSRVGTKCLVRTYAGSAQIFGEPHLAEATISCGENTLPTGFGSNLLFQDTQTGVAISPDGLFIVPLQASDVALMVSKIPKGYCYTPSDADGAGTGTPVDFVDAVPSKIVCESSIPQYGGDYATNTP